MHPEISTGIVEFCVIFMIETAEGEFSAESNADWYGDVIDRTSRTGFYIMLKALDAALSCCVKKQAPLLHLH